MYLIGQDPPTDDISHDQATKINSQLEIDRSNWCVRVEVRIIHDDMAELQI